MKAWWGVWDLIKKDVLREDFIGLWGCLERRTYGILGVNKEGWRVRRLDWVLGVNK